jgi:hypothetical protein
MNAYRILVGKPEEKRPLGRHRWVDNIKMDFREIEWGGMDWIDLAQDRDQWKALVNMVRNLLKLRNVELVFQCVYLPASPDSTFQFKCSPL